MYFPHHFFRFGATHLIVSFCYNSTNGSQLRYYKVRSTVPFVEKLDKENKGA